MNEHKYKLEPYKGMNTRYPCPQCNERAKTFSRYIDTETGKHLADHVGRCNRESNCGYHFTPKEFFASQGTNFEFRDKYARARGAFFVNPPPRPASYIAEEVLRTSLKGYDENNFVTFLNGLFGTEITSQLISRYFIATSKQWEGATVFWQIDSQGKVRAGKIMLYSPVTGKRVKEPFNHIDWVHTVTKQPAFNLRQCFFGEHLLQDRTTPVAIVESEKTAIIASVYLPQFIWLAVGSLTNLNAEKCNVLNGRSAFLFPDLNGFEKWSAKAIQLSHLATFSVSDLLERRATPEEKQQGLDLADHLLRFDYREFRKAEEAKPQPQTFEQPNQKEIEPVKQLRTAKEQYSPVHKENVPESWEKDIAELESYFESVTLPTVPVKLDYCTTITNVSLFIQSQLATVRAQNGKWTFSPYLLRLLLLKQILTNANRINRA